MFFLMLNIIANSQNLVGCSKDQIKKTMSKIRPKYDVDDTSLDNVNGSLKFMDADEERTLMYFIGKDGKCTFAKFIIDNAHLKNTIDTLNSKKYKYNGNLTWDDKALNGNDCIISIEKNQWFFTLIIQPK